jgi:anti-sigma regulatory factor (Ser/Thr protein kinase)
MDATGRFMRLPRNESAPQLARRWLQRRVDVLPPHDRANVVLLGHELVTNAVEHSDGDHLWVTMLLTPDVIRVEVADEGGPSEPAVLPLEPYATSGRGLRWVAELADEWGVAKGKAQEVWFQIHLDEHDHQPA